MNFDLAFFLQCTNKANLFDQVDTLVKPYAGEKHLWRWHPYESSRPHACIEHPPDAFITAEGVWHEVDVVQEEARIPIGTKEAKSFRRDTSGGRASPRSGYGCCPLSRAFWFVGI